jgi:hypothetical protein
LETGYSINHGDKSENAFPKFGNINYPEDKKSAILEVNFESYKEYQWVLTGRSFKSKIKLRLTTTK